MKARVKATGEIVEVERVTKNIYGRTDGIVAMYSKDVLDFNLDPPQPESTTIGWVARDRNGSLSLYQTFPERQENLGYWRDGLGEFDLSETDFPDLTWGSDPVEVEITIKPKKQ